MSLNSFDIQLEIEFPQMHNIIMSSHSFALSPRANK